MSTVILTKTHIGSDHCVVRKSFPPSTSTDIKHKKIFVDPKKQFLYATVGDFDPKKAASNPCNRFIRTMIEIILDQKSDLINIDDESVIGVHEMFFDKTGQTIIVTESSRHLMYYSGKLNCIKIAPCGDVSGVGAGGAFAEGMIAGGMSIEDIWKPLNQFEPLSSQAHTIVSLDILKPFIRVNEKGK